MHADAYAHPTSCCVTAASLPVVVVGVGAAVRAVSERTADAATGAQRSLPPNTIKFSNASYLHHHVWIISIFSFAVGKRVDDTWALWRTCQQSLKNDFRFSWEGRLESSFHSSSAVALTNPPLPPTQLSSVLLIAVSPCHRCIHLFRFQIILHLLAFGNAQLMIAPPTGLQNLNYSAFDDIFIIGGAMQLPQHHLVTTTRSLALYPLHTTFGISRPCPWQYKRIWFVVVFLEGTYIIHFCVNTPVIYRFSTSSSLLYQLPPSFSCSCSSPTCPPCSPSQNEFNTLTCSNLVRSYS